MLTRKQKIIFTLSMALCMALLFTACDNGDTASESDLDQTATASESDLDQTETEEGLSAYSFTTKRISGSVWFEEDNFDGVHISSLYLFNEDASFQRCHYENPPGISDIQTGEWSIDASGNLLLSIPGQETITVQSYDDPLFNDSFTVSIDDGTETIYSNWEFGGAYSFDDTMIQGTFITQDGDTWVFESDGTGSTTGEEGTFTWSVEDGILKVFFPDGRVICMYMRDGAIWCGCSPDQGDHDCYLVIDFAFVEYTDSGDIDSYCERMELIRQGDDAEMKVVFSEKGLGGIAVDSEGNLYLAEYDSNCVVKVSTDGVVTTVAGNGEEGFSGDGGPATSARLYAPGDVAVDLYGQIYIADGFNRRIRKVTPEGVISTIAGNGDSREGYDFFGWIGEEDEYFDGEPATSVGLFCPLEVTVDKDGNVYFYETGILGPPPSLIHQVSPDRMIRTVAGGGTEDIGDDVPATSIEIFWPHLAVDSAGYLYVSGNNCVIEVTPDGMVYTVAGTGTEGYSGDGGLATEAELSQPDDIAVDDDGNLYIADTDNDCIRMVTPEGVISTLIDGLHMNMGDMAIAPNGDLFIVEGGRLVLKLDLMTTN